MKIDSLRWTDLDTTHVKALQYSLYFKEYPSEYHLRPKHASVISWYKYIDNCAVTEWLSDLNEHLAPNAVLTKFRSVLTEQYSLVNAKYLYIKKAIILYGKGKVLANIVQSFISYKRWKSVNRILKRPKFELLASQEKIFNPQARKLKMLVLYTHCTLL